MSLTIELQPQEIKGLCQRYLREDQKQNDRVTQRGKSENDIFNIEVGKYTLKPISDGPSGFLGRHYYLNVEILMKKSSNENEKELQKLTFFAKSAPLENASRMEYLEEFGVFKKEIIVYREILPKLHEIFPNVAPKCFYADNNVLVFENLSQQGYKMAAARDGILDYEHLKCALKTLAAMQAGSICLEKKTGKKIRELFPEAVVENSYPMNNPDHLRRQYFNITQEVFKAFISSMPRYEKDLDFILTEMPRLMGMIFPLSAESEKYLNVFSHGDLWANNLMFHYSKFGDIPIQCLIVDFQLARYAPPMLDLLTLLTIPTSREFRQKYLNELLSDYYRFLTEFLKLEHLDIQDILPKSEFYKGIEEYRIYGLIESCLFSHLTVLPTQATEELTGSTEGFSDFFKRKRIDICMKAFKTDKIYRERLTDMLEDFVDTFILNNKK